MKMLRYFFPVLIVLLGSIGSGGAAAPEAGTVPQSARQLYAEARGKLLQIRVLVKATQLQAVIGSGFVVSEDGLVVTNYHVVSKFALDPETYALEYIRADGAKGTMSLTAVDVLHDLAVARTQEKPPAHFTLSAAELTKGEHIFSVGNPLDLGFTIVEGTYNGLVDGSFYDRIHFSGALNPGMSGGPALTEAGQVLGVNVAQARDGQSVSFLVPVRFVRELLLQATKAKAAKTEWASEIGAQLLSHQAALLRSLEAKQWPTLALGDYRVPDKPAHLGKCWSWTNQKATEHFQMDSTNCAVESEVFVDEDLQTGYVQFGHQLFRSKDLGPLRFYSMYGRNFSQHRFADGAVRSMDHVTSSKCTEEFVVHNKITFRAVLCARAYKKFPSLFDFFLALGTVDRKLEGLQSSVQLSGVSYENGLKFARRYVESILWKK